MMWYSIWSWLAFCILLTLVIRTNNVVNVPLFWRVASAILWMLSLIILTAQLTYMTYLALLAPAVKLFW